MQPSNREKGGRKRGGKGGEMIAIGRRRRCHSFFFQYLSLLGTNRRTSRKNRKRGEEKGKNDVGVRRRKKGEGEGSEGNGINCLL